MICWKWEHSNNSNTEPHKFEKLSQATWFSKHSITLIPCGSVGTSIWISPNTCLSLVNPQHSHGGTFPHCGGAVNEAPTQPRSCSGAWGRKGSAFPKFYCLLTHTGTPRNLWGRSWGEDMEVCFKSKQTFKWNKNHIALFFIAERFCICQTMESKESVYNQLFSVASVWNSPHDQINY